MVGLCREGGGAHRGRAVSVCAEGRRGPRGRHFVLAEKKPKTENVPPEAPLNVANTTSALNTSMSPDRRACAMNERRLSRGSSRLRGEGLSSVAHVNDLRDRTCLVVR